MDKGKNKLALIDFDGTITSKDTLISFVAYITPWYRWPSAFLRLLPHYIGYLTRILNAEQFKVHFLNQFIRHKSKVELENEIAEFHKKKLGGLLYLQALESIQVLRTRGYHIVLVSANIAPLVKPFCDKYQLECIATELEWVNGLYSGKLATQNCKGEEKARRICESLDLSGYEFIAAWGDHPSDLPMLHLAHFQGYRIFHKQPITFER